MALRILHRAEGKQRRRTRLSRRQVLAFTPAAITTVSSPKCSGKRSDDPVFAAIERRRRPRQRPVDVTGESFPVADIWSSARPSAAPW
jgi:hypothetical protein